MTKHATIRGEDLPAYFEVLRLLEELGRIEWDQLCLGHRCPSCRAEPGDPCRVRVGDRRHHLRRGDLAAMARNGFAPRAWRADMERYGARPETVLAEIRASRLYRIAEASGWLGEDAA
jgi:Fe2+ transport system protein FeoA